MHSPDKIALEMWEEIFGVDLLFHGVVLIPAALLVFHRRLGLTSSQLWLLLLLLGNGPAPERVVYDHNPETRSYPAPSILELAHPGHLAERQFRRNINAPENRNWFGIVPRATPRGKQLSNAYDMRPLYSRLDELIRAQGVGRRTGPAYVLAQLRELPLVFSPAAIAGSPAALDQLVPAVRAKVANYAIACGYPPALLSSGLVALPQALFRYHHDLGISPAQFCALCHLLCYIRPDECIQSLRHLSTYANFTHSYLCQLLRDLDALNLIDRKARYAPWAQEDGRPVRASSDYDFSKLWHALLTRQRMVLGSPDPPAQPPAVSTEPLPLTQGPSARGRGRGNRGVLHGDAHNRNRPPGTSSSIDGRDRPFMLRPGGSGRPRDRHTPRVPTRERFYSPGRRAMQSQALLHSGFSSHPDATRIAPVSPPPPVPPPHAERMDDIPTSDVRRIPDLPRGAHLNNEPRKSSDRKSGLPGARAHAAVPDPAPRGPGGRDRGPTSPYEEPPATAPPPDQVDPVFRADRSPGAGAAGLAAVALDPGSGLPGPGGQDREPTPAGGMPPATAPGAPIRADPAFPDKRSPLREETASTPGDSPRNPRPNPPDLAAGHRLDGRAPRPPTLSDGVVYLAQDQHTSEESYIRLSVPDVSPRPANVVPRAEHVGDARDVGEHTHQSQAALPRSSSSPPANVRLRLESVAAHLTEKYSQPDHVTLNFNHILKLYRDQGGSLDTFLELVAEAEQRTDKQCALHGITIRNPMGYFMKTLKTLLK